MKMPPPHSSRTGRYGLELEEIQGLIVSGYGDRPVASYALFEVVDAARARDWIGRMVPSIQFSIYRSTPRYMAPFLENVCFNLAFTYRGFEALGLDPTALAGFCLSFQGGLDDPHRARRLGDDGPSAPDNWTWGGPQTPRVHGLLAVFAGHGDAKEGDIELPSQAIAAEVHEGNGIRLVKAIHAHPMNRVLRKEHFGFRDGISNPRLAGLALKPNAIDVIADGEIVLGYPNAYGRFPLSPEVPAEADPQGDLPPPAEWVDDPESPSSSSPFSLSSITASLTGSSSSSSSRSPLPTRRDFGRNGSYLVFCQISQDVKAFWQYVFRAAAELPGAPKGREGAIWLASKMVGRWPNGTPVSLFPDKPGDDEFRDANDFTFNESNDAYGVRCPIGSHIRRTNPRDTGLPVPHDPELSGSPANEKVQQESIERANRHRILRRGRSYGAPLDPMFDPEAMLAAEERAGSGERGLLFLGLNANISRQFEFIRANWVLNPTFAGLSRDPDPLLGPQRACPFPASNFTLQGYPPRQLRHLPRVVETRGGAYFFLPSRSALLHLSRQR